ncbi:MAG TPA: DNA translocase FtsK 4TM domain-containing protein, partial [Candidatus Acidoferrum sp.]|nr:DNA translocase FtsK 4TM domain-containing protein [Candidatus Acidoferrum sp.]
MARARRKATARTRLNLEIVGIAAIGLAVLTGISLATPHHSGRIGEWIADALHHLFGGGAVLFPVLVALFGAILFLEVNVPRLIVEIGSSSLAFFFIVDTALGSGGYSR